MRTLLVALVALTLMPSMADARTVKGTTTVTVTNRGSDFLAVVADNPGLLDSETLDAATFFSAGGRLVGPRGSTVFVLRKGQHEIFFAYLSGVIPGSDIGAISSATVDTSTGSKKIVVTGSFDEGASTTVK